MRLSYIMLTSWHFVLSEHLEFLYEMYRIESNYNFSDNYISDGRLDVKFFGCYCK